jgi:hypothetical protein
VQVLLLEVPQLLRRILEDAVRSWSDCRLLKEASHEFEFGTEPGVAPDVVILGVTARDDTTLVPALFARWPSAQVMTVSQAGDEAAVWELRPRRRALAQMSAPDMMNELRKAVDEWRRNVQE